MSELTAEEKQRKGLRGLFRFLKRRDSEAALREAIEEFIEETRDHRRRPAADRRILAAAQHPEAGREDRL